MGSNPKAVEGEKVFLKCSVKVENEFFMKFSVVSIDCTKKYNEIISKFELSYKMPMDNEYQSIILQKP